MASRFLLAERLKQTLELQSAGWPLTWHIADDKLRRMRRDIWRYEEAGTYRWEPISPTPACPFEGSYFMDDCSNDSGLQGMCLTATLLLR